MSIKSRLIGVGTAVALAAGIGVAFASAANAATPATPDATVTGPGAGTSELPVSFLPGTATVVPFAADPTVTIGAATEATGK